VKKHHQLSRLGSALAVSALLAASCSSSDSDTTSSTDDPPASDTADTGVVDSEPVESESTEPPPVDSEPTETDPPDSAPSDTDASQSEEPAAEGGADFGSRAPATGEPILFGMVNTEGTAGLDFPEMRTDTDLAVTYLNEHGGMGGRPVRIEHCAAVGSPETSQACAQELSGKGVELVMLGLDLFPGYDTFAASSIPVVGALPILPPDYTANALFVTGGNATTMAAMVALAVEEFDASTVGIISADNPGANGSEAALTAALDKAGLTYVSIKGGDNETDAGFQGLIREANSDNPDVLVSLYADAGCIGAMRGRAALGIETPMISTPICGSAEVLDVVGDDAAGWYFVAVGAPEDTASAREFDDIIAPVYGSGATGTLGLGALGITQVMTLARVANSIADGGGDVTGQAIYDVLGSTTELLNFPNDSLLGCGSSATYPSVCSFEFPIGRYGADGEIETVPGFEAFNVAAYLP
jgi:branched-chain amino acid transport system substrate-binding protein